MPPRVPQYGPYCYLPNMMLANITIPRHPQDSFVQPGTKDVTKTFQEIIKTGWKKMGAVEVVSKWLWG
jgi:hypothetical protein